MEEALKPRAHPKSPFNARQGENGEGEGVQRESSKMKHQGSGYRRSGVIMGRRLKKEKVGKGSVKGGGSKPCPSELDCLGFQEKEAGQSPRRD